MSKAQYLRERAALMFALSIVTHDEELRGRLALQASDCLDQAVELERADATVTQQAQQLQPDDSEKKE
jgi:hypothetical protein